MQVTYGIHTSSKVIFYAFCQEIVRLHSLSTPNGALTYSRLHLLLAHTLEVELSTLQNTILYQESIIGSNLITTCAQSKIIMLSLQNDCYVDRRIHK